MEEKTEIICSWADILKGKSSRKSSTSSLLAAAKSNKKTQLQASRQTAVSTLSFCFCHSIFMFDYLLHQQTLSGPPSWAPIITLQHSGLLFLVASDDSKERITSGHLSISLINNDLKVYRPPVCAGQKPTKDYALNP